MAATAPGTDERTPTCPECGSEVQSTWRWCLACGYDPDGLREQHERRRPTAAEAGAPDEAAGSGRGAGWGWTALVVVVGLVAAGSIYLARSRSTTPADASSVAADAGAGAPDVSTTQPSWTTFQSAEGAYSVEVPATPTIESYDVPFAGSTRTFHNATAIFGEDSYVVSYVDVDADEAARPPDNRLQAFANAYATVIGGTPQATTPLTVDGNPALDFSFDIKGAGRNRSRTILKGTRVYTISLMGAAPKDGDFDRMARTFRIS